MYIICLKVQKIFCVYYYLHQTGDTLLKRKRIRRMDVKVRYELYYENYFPAQFYKLFFYIY